MPSRKPGIKQQDRVGSPDLQLGCSDFWGYSGVTPVKKLNGTRLPDFRWFAKEESKRSGLPTPVALPESVQECAYGGFLNSLTSVTSMVSRVLAIHRKPGVYLQIKTSQITCFKHIAPFYNSSEQCKGKSCPVLYCEKLSVRDFPFHISAHSDSFHRNQANQWLSHLSLMQKI